MKDATLEYQHGFSEMHREEMYDGEARAQKAHKTIAVIRDYLDKAGVEAGSLSLLDIGCSTGYLSRLYGQHFGRVVGIDIDAPAVEFANRNNELDHIEFHARDSMQTGFPDQSFDAVTCTQVYEHVPDAKRLLSEIHRVLKPGGFCYFAAGNRVKLVEAHYRLPLLSVIPKWLAHIYIRLAGKAESYYETHYSLWGLRRLVSDFEIVDYTPEIIGDPVKYHATDMVRPGTLKQQLSLAILRAAYWTCPTYIWILRKPAFGSATKRVARTRIKMALSAVPFGSKLARAILSLGFGGSRSYWENRYNQGGNSGAGSYGAPAEFKSRFLKNFLRHNGIRSVIDFGCGDGNQIASFNPDRYVGLDVSRTAIEICREKYKSAPSKTFVKYDPGTSFDELPVEPAELAMSLDVIYHLVEDEVFEAYIANLFAAARRFVVIYSSDHDGLTESPHVRHRNVTAHIESAVPGWTLHEQVENPHKGELSECDFFVYRRQDAGAS